MKRHLSFVLMLTAPAVVWCLAWAAWGTAHSTPENPAATTQAVVLKSEG